MDTREIWEVSLVAALDAQIAGFSMTSQAFAQLAAIAAGHHVTEAEQGAGPTGLPPLLCSIEEID